LVKMEWFFHPKTLNEKSIFRLKFWRPVRKKCGEHRAKMVSHFKHDFRLILQVKLEFNFLQIKFLLRVASEKGQPHPVSTPAVI